jgi:putative hydrolase of the HAD superfamily
LPFRYEAVLLDALGTLVRLETPWPLLRSALRSRHSIEVSEEDAKRAMLAEMAYYRAHHRDGRDAASLADLRSRCAAVLGAELPEARRLAPGELVEALLSSIRFSPYPDAAPALAAMRALDIRTAVVSNWDCSLRGILGELGLTGLLDAVVTSAEAGASKPDAAVFRAALQELRCPAEKALFVGDSPQIDVAGGRAAGMRAVLIDRGPSPATAPAAGAEVERIFSLEALQDLVWAPIAH